MVEGVGVEHKLVLASAELVEALEPTLLAKLVLELLEQAMEEVQV